PPARLGGRTRIPVYGDVGAGLRQRDRHGVSQPGRGAGDERDAAVQPKRLETGGRRHPTRNSSRTGVKMSINTTSSSSIVAPWRTFAGKCRTSPAIATRAVSPIVNRA